MPESKGAMGIAKAQGKIYVFGGEAPTHTFEENEEYVPKTNHWGKAEPLPFSKWKE